MSASLFSWYDLFFKSKNGDNFQPWGRSIKLICLPKDVLNIFLSFTLQQVNENLILGRKCMCDGSRISITKSPYCVNNSSVCYKFLLAVRNETFTTQILIVFPLLPLAIKLWFVLHWFGAFFVMTLAMPCQNFWSLHSSKNKTKLKKKMSRSNSTSNIK